MGEMERKVLNKVGYIWRFGMLVKFAKALVF